MRKKRGKSGSHESERAVSGVRGLGIYELCWAYELRRNRERLARAPSKMDQRTAAGAAYAECFSGRAVSVTAFHGVLRELVLHVTGGAALVFFVGVQRSCCLVVDAMSDLDLVSRDFP